MTDSLGLPNAGSLNRRQVTARPKETDSSVGHQPVSKDRQNAARDTVSDIFLPTIEDVNTVDGSGRTPLHQAVNKRDVPAIKALLAKGADLEARDQRGNTPLHVATRNGYAEIAKELLDAGANLKARVTHGLNAGKTPIELGSELGAEKGKFEEVFDKAEQLANFQALEQMLKSPGKLDTLDLKDAIELIKAGVGDSRRILQTGYTLLHLAAEIGDRADLGELIKEGANLEAKTSGLIGGGRTPLHYAAESGNPAAIHTLLDAGVDVNAIDDIGNTLLHYATKNGNQKLLQVLIARGADPTIENSKGKTPAKYSTY